MNVLGLCAGINGLELALSIATAGRAKPVCLVEREAYAQAVLVARMEDKAMGQAPVWSDLATFDGKPWSGKVDCIAAGLPCQSFSTAGKRRGIEDERWIWPDMLRVLRECGASVVFGENVTGLRKHGLPIILRDLAALGFHAEWGCFSAQGVGAPHVRKRLFVLAVANSDRQRFKRERKRWLLEGERAPCGDDFDRCSGQAVGNTVGGRRGARAEVPEKEGGDPESFGAGWYVANSDGSGLARRGRVTEDDEGQEPAFERGGGLGSVADSDGAILREQSGGGGRACWQGQAEPGGLFPPGRDERLWDRVQESAQPSICRGAHGDAAGLVDRRDRLRCIGNAVVPLVGAYAFSVLAARICE